MANKDMRYSLSLFSFVMITAATVISIRILPTEGIIGWQTILFNVLAIVIYLIPCSLVAAELATGWPGTGGVYVWVKEAFGERWGFTASWIQWFQMTTGFIGILAFIAGTFAYLFNPALANNKPFIFLVILVVWWGATILNFRGLKTYARYTTAFVILGTFIPMVILIAGGLWLVGTGYKTLIPVFPTWTSLVPSFTNLNQFVLLVNFVFVYIGIEVTAAHAQEMKNVKRDYPLAIFIVGLVMVVSAIVGSRCGLGRPDSSNQPDCWPYAVVYFHIRFWPILGCNLDGDSSYNRISRRGYSLGVRPR